MPPRIFTMCLHEDYELARRQCDDSRACGLDSFPAAHSVRAHDDMALGIARGKGECGFCVPVLSHAALESPWCESETNRAISLSTTCDRGGRPRIVPVSAEDGRDALSMFLLTRLSASFAGRYDDALKELLTRGFAKSIAPPPDLASVPPTPVVQALARTIVGKDGRERVLIPAGEFLMGGGVYLNEMPPHNVYVDAFYIDRYPVTNAEYKKFVDATKHKVLPRHWKNKQIPPGQGNHPVVYVSWDDAAAYAEWAGGRLPTEAEWEKAARGTDARRYPWGNYFDAGKCNTYESAIKNTTPVGEYSPHGDSPYGVGDLAGNVWEWCADSYDKYYYRNSPPRNPKGPDSGELRVKRGGSWSLNQLSARCASRQGDLPGYRHISVGFRVAMSAHLALASGS